MKERKNRYCMEQEENAGCMEKKERQCAYIYGSLDCIELKESYEEGKEDLLNDNRRKLERWKL